MGSTGTASTGTERARRRRTLFVGTLAVLLAAAMGCVPEPPEPATGDSPNDAPRAGDPAYAEAGPFAAGVTTLQLADRPVEVWYPTDPGAVEGLPRDSYAVRDYLPAAILDLLPEGVDGAYETDAVRDVPATDGGPFPVVLFSHGFAGYRVTSTFLTTHLASWGFVVIAPEYLERGLRSVLGEPPATPRRDTVVADEAIQALAAASATPGDLLEGLADTSSVFPIGHSAGGGTSLRLLERPDVPSAIPMASGVSLLSLIQGNAPDLPADRAVTWIGGRLDGIAAIDDVRNGFTYTAGPRRLVELNGAGHNNAFTEICEIGDGGLAALARATGLPVPEPLLALGDDGCRVPPNVDSPQVWDEVRHFVTAELRFRSGVDPEPVGLGDAVVGAFDQIGRYRHDP